MTNAEINRAIAEQVMGASVIPTGVSAPFNVPHCRVQRDGVVLIAFGHKAPFLYRDWSPAESMRDAMEALEKWRKQKCQRWWSVTSPLDADDDMQFEVMLRNGCSLAGKQWESKHESQPLAICLALLEAVKGKP